METNKEATIRIIEAMSIPPFSKNLILRKLRRMKNTDISELNKIVRQEQRLLKYKGSRILKIQRRNYERMKTVMRKHGLRPRETAIVLIGGAALGFGGDVLLGSSLVERSWVLAKLGITAKVVSAIAPWIYLGGRVAINRIKRGQSVLPKRLLPKGLRRKR